MTDKLADALRACPFCPDGGEPNMHTYQDGYSVVCNTCCGMTGYTTFPTKEEAQYKWNTRHEAAKAATPDDVREEAAKVLDKILAALGVTDCHPQSHALFTSYISALRNTQGVPIDTMAELLYLRFCHECGVTCARWELNDSKDVWREKAILDQHARGG